MQDCKNVKQKCAQIHYIILPLFWIYLLSLFFIFYYISILQ